MKQYDIIVPKPHSDLQRIIMKAFVNPHIRECYVACGTKFGKTFSCAGALAFAAPRSPGSVWRWFAPISSQSRIGMRYIRKMFPKPPFIDINKAAGTIEIPTLELLLQFLHGSNPENNEGEGTKGNVLDEASKLDEQIYNSVHTTVTMTMGKIMAPSTPRGRNWFYKKCMAARQEMMRALREGRQPTKFFITAPTAANPHVPRESIEHARQNLPDRLFRQYYLAEFVDDATVFSGFRACIPILNHIQCLELGRGRTRWLEPHAKNARVVIGADWAKSNDFVVLTAWEYAPEGGGKPRLIGFDRFQGVDYPIVINETVAFAKEFGHIAMLFHDKTGIGAVIDDMLASTGLPYEGVVFTNDSKSYMVNNLVVAIQRRDCQLLNWPEMIHEMDAYEVTTNKLGRMRYNGPEGMHDDIVSSMILGWSAVLEFANVNLEVKSLGDIPYMTSGDKLISNFYESIADDDDGF